MAVDPHVLVVGPVPVGDPVYADEKRLVNGAVFTDWPKPAADAVAVGVEGAVALSATVTVGAEAAEALAKRFVSPASA